MRVALIVTGGVDPSGRERVVPALLWLVERLARRYDVHVFALHYLRKPQSYPLLGATVHDLGRVDGPIGLRRWRIAARLRRALHAVGRFDVVHAYWGMPAIAAARSIRGTGTPLVVTLDSGELVAIPEIAYGLQRRWIDRRAVGGAIAAATRVTVCSRYMAASPLLAGVRVDVVPIGVETTIFTPAPRSPGPPWRLVRVGSLNRVKDYPTLLRAMRAIVDRGVDVHLDIAGEDTRGGVIQQLAGTLAIANRVTFHGALTTDAIVSLYRRAHVHVVSSRHEAASVAMLEAAACGVPTVSTCVGYAAEWADDDRAVAVPVGDPAAFADAVIGLLHDPARRERIAAAAREWTLHHDADWTADRFGRLYADAAASDAT